MALGAWKTERMMRRYSAVTAATLRAAAETITGSEAGRAERSRLEMNQKEGGRIIRKPKARAIEQMNFFVIPLSRRGGVYASSGRRNVR